MATPSQPPDILGWPINAYWAAHPEHHWYICFCLLVSAIHDRFSGKHLSLLENFNWATSCYYYSMVHVGRLALFSAVGDYPTSHEQLRCVFRIATATNEEDVTVKFNWLKRFLKDQRVELGQLTH